ncbi:MAG: (2Fe-2S)-binding protein [Deltaproteobacteria bacterium]|nr:(2Fe-2S)-binding protein [Deltaproteobacteria bacterium]
MITLTIDNREITAKEGATLLQVCLDHDIYIPHLCYLEGMEHAAASCRLCFVEIEGVAGPVTSCTTIVKEGMVVKTDTEVVRHLQRASLQLLLSVHHVDCAHCPANRKCALQDMAKFLKVGLKPKYLEQHLKEPEIDQGHPYLDYYPNRCVLCGRCVLVCKNSHDRPFLTFAKRGLDTVISFYEEDRAEMPCDECLACVEICPVSALMKRKVG